ncbi:3-hydroxyacyl-CoA dehydrogenase [Thalassiella azotivora]
MTAQTDSARNESAITVAVVGAGTMGAGIAEVAARAGHPVLLLDQAVGAAGAAVEAMRVRLDRDVEKGRLDADTARAVADRVTVTGEVADLAPAGLVVEAIVERLDAKRALFAEVERVVAPDCVLATNTSSLSVTAVAAGLERPERVVGLHFFNPAQRMRLVEVVRGEDTAPDVVDTALDLARSWGKTPVTCSSTPGFVVNRVARPYYGEAHRLVEEGVTDPATVDALLKEAGGFPMGPFELTDLVGQDVNLAVSRSVWDLTFHDPRYAPTVFQQRLVDAGRYGRKTGRGVYAYDGSAERPEPRTEPDRPAPSEVRVSASLDFGHAIAFLDRARAGGVAFSATDDEDDEPGVVLPSGGVLRLTDGTTALSWSADDVTGVVLMDWVRDPATCTRVALAAAPGCPDTVLAEAVGLCQAAGAAVTVLPDTPGLVVARTVSMLVNEAADLVARGEASAADVDTAMRLGTGYPLGPLEWGDLVGAEWVESVLGVLDRTVTTGRYRVAPAVRTAALTGRSLLG